LKMNKTNSERAHNEQFQEELMRTNGSRTAASMKKFTVLFLLFALLGTLLFSCDSADDTVSGTSAQTTTNNLIQAVDIEQNEVLIETAPNAWTVGYMDYPDDIVSKSNMIMPIGFLIKVINNVSIAQPANMLIITMQAILISLCMP